MKDHMTLKNNDKPIKILKGEFRRKLSAAHPKFLYNAKAKRQAIKISEQGRRLAAAKEKKSPKLKKRIP